MHSRRHRRIRLKSYTKTGCCFGHVNRCCCVFVSDDGTWRHHTLYSIPAVDFIRCYAWNDVFSPRGLRVDVTNGINFYFTTMFIFFIFTIFMSNTHHILKVSFSHFVHRDLLFQYRSLNRSSFSTFTIFLEKLL